MDFKNPEVLKLRSAGDAYANQFTKQFKSFLTDGETVETCFKSVRDGVIFTNKRIIIVDIEGIGKKKSFTSLPYSKIQTFSVESAGMFDIDSELIINFSGLKQVKLEFLGTNNISRIYKIISSHVL